MADLSTLVLEPDNPSNTRITDSDTGKLLYEVFTDHGKETVTKVKRADGEIIASWEWHDFKSDRITLGKAPPVPVNAWLKKSLVPFKDTVRFTDDRGRELKWKGTAPGESLRLFSENDKGEPLARFIRSLKLTDRKVTPHTASYQPARLVLDHRGAEVQDLVIISFLVLERPRREADNESKNRASAIASASAYGAA